MTTPLPLTTLFDPPSSCFSSFFRVSAWDRLGPSPTATECFPSGWNGQPGYYFSPGICPNGYTTASVSTNTVETLSETVVQCCPSAYSWTSVYSGAFAASTSVCFSWYNDGPATAAHTIADYSGTSLIQTTDIRTMTRGIGEALATPVEVRYKAQDLYSQSSTLSSSISSSSSPSATSAAAATTSAGPTNSAKSGLSTGVKAGIGVGVSAGVLLLCAIVIGIILLLKRKPARHESPVATEPMMKETGKNSEPLMKHELDAKHPVVELVNTSRVFELGN